MPRYQLSEAADAALAVAVVELIASSPAAVARLVELFDDHRAVPTEPVALVYTVTSLAGVLDVSPRVIRGAIARGELAAVKRGGRWIISAEAVREWAHQPDVSSPARRRRTRSRRPLGSAIAHLQGANANRPLL